MMERYFKRLVSNFLQGLLFIAPIAVTVFAVVWFVNLVDDLFNPWLSDWLPIHIPGIGILISFVLLALIGFVVSNLISRSAIGWFERMMNRAPLVKVIYFSVKDILNVFFKKEDQLGQPIKVLVQNDPKQYRLGFVSGADLGQMGFDEDLIAVYLPFSYGIMGNLLYVEKQHVEYLDMKPSDVMKLIVSGGMTKVDKQSEPENQIQD
ncbi:MAG: putative membrane protein [Flavobacteriales bacterium]|jgi:uncharacterized membrane protein